MTAEGTRRITNTERIPPVVAPKVAELVDEALQLAEQAQSVRREWERISQALSLLSEDAGLGIETTSHDPDAERLNALLQETGMNAVADLIDHAAGVLLGDPSRESLATLRRRLGLPAKSS